MSHLSWKKNVFVLAVNWRQFFFVQPNLSFAVVLQLQKHTFKQRERTKKNCVLSLSRKVDTFVHVWPNFLALALNLFQIKSPLWVNNLRNKTDASCPRPQAFLFWISPHSSARGISSSRNQLERRFVAVCSSTNRQYMWISRQQWRTAGTGTAGYSRREWRPLLF